VGDKRGNREAIWNTTDGTYMTDEEALQLLRLLWRYVRFAGDQPPDHDLTISEIVDDLTMSDESGVNEVQDLAIAIKAAVE